MKKGTLFVIATPIGNLEDMTLRAIDVLKKVPLIACEDTRQTRKLLNRYDIRTKCTSYHRFNELTKSGYILTLIENGEDVALVSDAGTPGISDPGHLLVKLVSERGGTIVPIPGPSALTSALSVSAIPLEAFSFHGFVPKKKSERMRFLKHLSLREETLVFFESPHRIISSLSDMTAAFGLRKAVLCRELTKIHEEVLRGTLDDILESLKNRLPVSLKGEFTVIIEGAHEKADEDTEIPMYDHYKTLVEKKGFAPLDAIKSIARLTGLPKRMVYKEILKKEGKVRR